MWYINDGSNSNDIDKRVRKDKKDVWMNTLTDLQH